MGDFARNHPLGAEEEERQEEADTFQPLEL